MGYQSKQRKVDIINNMDFYNNYYLLDLKEEKIEVANCSI